MNRMPPAAEMQRAYLQSDAAYEGLFYLGVRTTGIFCRPTCPARKPLVANVEFFPSPGAALTAGYRPCKRCHPLESGAEPQWMTGLIADVERHPSRRISETDLRARGIDPATARRHFRRHYGMTFQAFLRSRRLAGALTLIREGRTDRAVSAGGYRSESGFREAIGKIFGAAPLSAAAQPRVFLSWINSPLGPLVAGATDDGVCFLEFTDRRMLEAQLATLRRRFPGPVAPGSNDHLDRLRTQLDEYFAGTRSAFSISLIYPGTPFQRRVWDALLEIPHGQTRSYEDLAAAIGQPHAARAVGRANGMNRIAILIPCHRVVNKGGALGGYGGGLRRKQFLLDLERTPAPSRPDRRTPVRAAATI